MKGNLPNAMACRIACLLLVGLLGMARVDSFHPLSTHQVSRRISSDSRLHLRPPRRLVGDPPPIPAKKRPLASYNPIAPLSSATRAQNDLTTKYVMLGLLWSIACLSALDRVAMSVAIVPMAEELGLTDTVKGSISSFFSIGYGLAILPAGLLVAELSPRAVMAGGLALWSVATMATPASLDIAASMLPLLVARAMVGCGESVILPTIQRLLTSWTDEDEKSTALACIFSGFHTGTIAAYMLSPLVMEELGGWRGLFYLYGAVGLVILLPWLALAQDRPVSDLIPERKVATSQSLVQVWESALQTVRSAPWRDFATSKGAWALLLAHSAKNWGLYNTLAWTPTFYAEAYHIGVRDSALLSVLPSVTGAVAGIAVASLADSMLRDTNGGDQEQSQIRKVFQSAGFLGQAAALGTLAYHIPDQPWVAQTLLMAAVGFQSFGAAGFEAGIQEKAGEKWAGLLYSVTSLPAVMAGTLGVYATGRLLDLTNQDWSTVFGLNAIISIVGAAAYVSLYNSKREFD